MERDAAVDDDTPMEPRRESPAWVRTARLTFLHHARGDWLLPLSLLAFAGPLVLVLVMATTDLAAQDAALVLPALHGVLGVVLPVLLLLMTLSSFRGAWLLDPDAAASRLGGYLAGTLVALLAGLLPWALAAALLAALLGDVAGALAGAPLHLAALLLLAAAWMSVFLLAGVAVRDPERRWVAAGVTWAALGPLLAYLAENAVQTWRFATAARFDAVPWWGHLLTALSPTRAYEALIAPDAPLAAFGGSAFAAASVLLAWVALPFAVATFLQKRRGA